MSAPALSIPVSAVAGVLTRMSKTYNPTATTAAIGLILPARDPRAIRAALALTDHDKTGKRGTRHNPRLKGTGAAARAVQSDEINYRAAYIEKASARMTDALKSGQSVREAMRAERTYYKAHEAARANRQASALKVDAATAAFGDTLGWRSRDDGKVSPECKAAHGANFSATSRPRIGWPGSVHPKCRCLPGPAWATKRTVDGSTIGMKVA